MLLSHLAVSLSLPLQCQEVLKGSCMMRAVVSSVLTTLWADVTDRERTGSGGWTDRCEGEGGVCGGYVRVCVAVKKWRQGVVKRPPLTERDFTPQLAGNGGESSADSAHAPPAWPRPIVPRRCC